MRIEGTGIWSGQLRYGDAGVIAEAAAELDELGFAAIWIPDVGGDVLGSVETLLARRAAPHRSRPASSTSGCTNRPRSRQRRASWSDAWKQRFLLGLGVSHAPLIDHNNPGPVPEAAREDGRVPRRPRRRRGSVPGRRARFSPRSGRRCSASHASARPARTPTSSRPSTSPAAARSSAPARRSRSSSRWCSTPIRRRPGRRPAGTPRSTSACPTTPTTCASSASATTTSPTGAATGWSTPSWRGAISTPSPRGSRRCARPAPTTCASR